MNLDLIALKNVSAIARSVRNLVLTVPGEKPFQPEVGSNVTNLLFENLDELTATAIKNEITNTIVNFEPRVELNSVDVQANFDSNAFDVTVQYFIIGIDVPEQQLSFVLQLTR